MASGAVGLQLEGIPWGQIAASVLEARQCADVLKAALEALKTHADSVLFVVERAASGLDAAAARLGLQSRPQPQQQQHPEPPQPPRQQQQQQQQQAPQHPGPAHPPPQPQPRQQQGELRPPHPSSSASPTTATAEASWCEGPRAARGGGTVLPGGQREGVLEEHRDAAYWGAARAAQSAPCPTAAWLGEAVEYSPGQPSAPRPVLGTLQPQLRLFVFCGHDGRACLDSTEVLDLATMTFSPGPSTGHQRNVCAVTHLSARQLLILGGSHGTTMPESTDTTEIFDVESFSFSPGPLMVSSRGGCAAVRLDETRILVIGGESHFTALASTEILDQSTMAFSPGPSMRSRRNLLAAARIDSERVIVVGGNDGPERHSSSEVLDTASMTFLPGPHLATARAGSAIVRVDPRTFLVLGGFDGRSRLSTTEVLDTVAMRFAPGPSMPCARSGCAAVRVDLNYVMILGGVGDGGRLDSTDLLDLRTRQYRAGPRMIVPRAGLAALMC